MNGKPVLTGLEKLSIRQTIQGQGSQFAGLAALLTAGDGHYPHAKVWNGDGAKKQELIALFQTISNIQCDFCGGNGHRKANCGTKKTLGAVGKAMNLKFELGMLKGIVYDEVENIHLIKCGCQKKKRY